MKKLAVPSVTAIVDLELLKEIYRNHVTGKGRIESGYLTALRIDTFVRFLSRKNGECNASNAYIARHLGIGKSSVYSSERVLSQFDKGRKGRVWNCDKFTCSTQIPTKFIPVPEYALFDLSGEEFALLTVLCALSENYVFNNPEKRENDSREGVIPVSVTVPLSKKALSERLSSYVGMGNYEVLRRKIRALTLKGYMVSDKDSFKLTPYTVIKRAKHLRGGASVFEILKNKTEEEKPKPVESFPVLDLKGKYNPAKLAYAPDEFTDPSQTLERMWCEGVATVTKNEAHELSNDDKIILYKGAEAYNSDEVRAAMNYLFDSWDSLSGKGKINPKPSVKWFVSAIPALISRVRNRLLNN